MSLQSKDYLTESGKGIYAAMAAIQRDFPAVTKEGINPSQKYKFRGIDDALKALNPLLSKHGVFMVAQDLKVSISDTGAKTSNGTPMFRSILTGTVIWYHLDGSSIESSIVGEGIDMGDKGTMKAHANALKYLCWYTFAVPTESEKKDSESFADG